MTLRIKQTRIVMMLFTYLILSFAAILYAARSFWDRRRWRTLANLVEDWAEKDFGADEDLPEIRWRLLTASWLAEAEFTPNEGVKYLDFAVLYAKARTGLTLDRMAKG